MVSRDDALKIVNEYVKNQNLIKHMLAVEACMAVYAKKYGEDEELWKVVGLLHDFDWEIHPSLEKHPHEGAKILKKKGVDENIIRTILSHADHTGIPREKLIDKALFACDDITGLIVAVALVRPSKKLTDVKIKSIKKKWKDTSFAAGVDRQAVEKAAQDLGVDLWQEHIPTVLKAMQEIANELGL